MVEELLARGLLAEGGVSSGSSVGAALLTPVGEGGVVGSAIGSVLPAGGCELPALCVHACVVPWGALIRINCAHVTILHCMQTFWLVCEGQVHVVELLEGLRGSCILRKLLRLSFPSIRSSLHYRLHDKLPHVRRPAFLD